MAHGSSSASTFPQDTPLTVENPVLVDWTQYLIKDIQFTCQESASDLQMIHKRVPKTVEMMTVNVDTWKWDSSNRRPSFRGFSSSKTQMEDILNMLPAQGFEHLMKTKMVFFDRRYCYSRVGFGFVEVEGQFEEGNVANTLVRMSVRSRSEIEVGLNC